VFENNFPSRNISNEEINETGILRYFEKAHDEKISNGISVGKIAS
jgi:hypothetical protein